MFRELIDRLSSYIMFNVGGSRVNDRVCPECSSRTWSYVGDVGYCYICEANFVVGPTRNYASTDASAHYASLIARNCLQLGIDVANKVRVELGSDHAAKVYVFDSSSSFTSAPSFITPGGYRYKECSSGVAVLSQAAQMSLIGTLDPVNTYCQIAQTTELVVDSIGVYIAKEPERHQDLGR